MKRLLKYVLVCFLIFSPSVASAQVATTTYYLHKETVAPWTTTPTLRLANPDQGSSFAQSPTYRNLTTPYLDPAWKIFRSVGPSTPGTIIAGSKVTFTAYLKKSAGWGIIYPYFKLWTYDNDDLMTGALIPVCSATGTVALDTSITKYVVSCTTSLSTPMTATRAYRMDVGSYVTSSPSPHSVNVAVYFDGISFSGTYPSSVAIPNSIPPAITGLSSSSGTIGVPVTINGFYFGDAQGTAFVNDVPTVISVPRVRFNEFLDDTQEINYRYVAKAIADLGFQGYVAHEFRPAVEANYEKNLKDSVEIMRV